MSPVTRSASSRIKWEKTQLPNEIIEMIMTGMVSEFLNYRLKFITSNGLSVRPYPFERSEAFVADLSEPKEIVLEDYIKQLLADASLLFNFRSVIVLGHIDSRLRRLFSRILEKIVPSKGSCPQK